MDKNSKNNIPNIRFDRFDEEWEKKIFQDLYKTASEGGTPDTTKKEYYENGEIPFVKIEDTEQKYITDTEAHITQEGVDNSSAWVVPEDSVIFTNGATVGNVAINKIPVTTKQGILGVVPNESVDAEFLYNSLSTSHFQNEVKRREAKGTFATITLKNMNEIEILNTSLEEQKKIAEFFKQLDKLIELNEQKVEKLELLKKALLEKIFPVGGGNNSEN